MRTTTKVIQFPVRFRPRPTPPSPGAGAMPAPTAPVYMKAVAA